MGSASPLDGSPTERNEALIAARCHSPSACYRSEPTSAGIEPQDIKIWIVKEPITESLSLATKRAANACALAAKHWAPDWALIGVELLQVFGPLAEESRA